MVRMAQDFKMRVPLIDGQGNFGSIDGDASAASRYTEARLSKEAEYLLEDLDKNIIPMVDNFDGLEQEPLVLPARIPNLYINGSQGIAIGIATNIPTHNPKEIIDAIIYYIDHKKVKLEKLLEIMPGPDFSTGGIIINKNELLNLYKTGLGRVVTRAKLEYKHNKVGKDSIIVTEIPYSYSGNKTKIIEIINDCIINKTLPELSEVRDESDKTGIYINLVLKKELTKEEFKKLESKLYKFTPLQTSETYNFMVTDNLRPKQIGLLEYIECFYNFQKELTKNKYIYLIDKYQARLEILDGLKKALDLIDVIIEIARYSKNNQAIKDCLMKGDISNVKFKTKSYETKAKKLCFSERQALAIMAIKLQDLSNFEVLELEKEYLDIQKKISDAQKIISDSKTLDSEIKKYLNQYKKELDVPRKTIITNDKIDTYKEEKVIEDVYFCIDKFNYIKVINENELDSNPECQYLNSNNDDKIIIFCDDGNAYTFKTEDILKTKNMSARGILLDTLLKTKNSEDLEILFVTTESNLNNLKLLFVSTDAFIKTCMADEFIASKTILKATVLNSGARVAKIYDVSDNLGNLELISDKDRKLIRPIKDIQTYKKTSRGVIGLKLKDSESIKEINIKK
jgi:DNA gyrase subunit A